MQTVTPWAAPHPVVRQLSTKEGFTKAVAAKDNFMAFASGFFVLGLLLVGYNIFSTIRTINEYSFLGYNWDDLWFVFTTTTDAQGDLDPLPFLYVWGSVVLLALAAILFAVSLATRTSRYDSAFAAFSADGYAAMGLGLPFSYMAGKVQMVPQVVVPPALGSPEVSQWLADLAQSLSSLDKSESKKLGKALGSAIPSAEAVVPAEKIFPGAPPFALLVGAPSELGGESVRAVVPGAKKTLAYIVNLTKVEGWGPASTI